MRRRPRLRWRVRRRWIRLRPRWARRRRQRHRARRGRRRVPARARHRARVRLGARGARPPPRGRRRPLRLLFWLGLHVGAVVLDAARLRAHAHAPAVGRLLDEPRGPAAVRRHAPRVHLPDVCRRLAADAGVPPRAAHVDPELVRDGAQALLLQAWVPQITEHGLLRTTHLWFISCLPLYWAPPRRALPPPRAAGSPRCAWASPSPCCSRCRRGYSTSYRSPTTAPTGDHGTRCGSGGRRRR